jgi:hypothetical protein
MVWPIHKCAFEMAAKVRLESGEGDSSPFHSLDEPNDKKIAVMLKARGLACDGLRSLTAKRA